MNKCKNSVFLLDMPSKKLKVIVFTYKDINRMTGISVSTLSKYLRSGNILVMKNVKIERVSVIKDQRGRVKA